MQVLLLRRSSEDEADARRHRQALDKVPAASRDEHRVTRSLCVGRLSAPSLMVRTLPCCRTRTVSKKRACSNSGKRPRSGFSTSTRLMVPWRAASSSPGAGSPGSAAASGHLRCSAHDAVVRYRKGVLLAGYSLTYLYPTTWVSKPGVRARVSNCAVRVQSLRRFSLCTPS